MNTLSLCITLFIFVHPLIAQNSVKGTGARAMALGYSSSTLRDEWSIHNNVSGIAGLKQPVAGFTYEVNPAFPTFNRIAALLALPIKKIGVAGMGLYRFGDALYNEQILSIGFANTMGLASLGVKVNLVQYHTEGFGNKQALTVSFGGIAELTPQLLIGAHIVNINQPELSEQSRERMPTLLVLGLGFQPFEKLLLTSEVEKDIDHPLCWKGGVEYKAHKKFVARTGFNVNPQAGFAGVGFKPRKFQLDYALQYHMNLGAIHQATVIYPFPGK